MATNYGSDWEIKNTGKTCTATGREFKDKEEVFSRLLFTEEGYNREDYSLDQWTDELKKTSVSSWKSVYLAPPPKHEEAFDKNDAESLLRHLMEKKNPDDKNTIYVLALMLERKRQMAEKGVDVQDSGEKVRIYEHKATGDTFIIPDPGLNLNELEDVQLEVAIALGWRPPNTEEEGEAPAEPAENDAAKTESAKEGEVPAEPEAEVPNDDDEEEDEDEFDDEAEDEFDEEE